MESTGQREGLNRRGSQKAEKTTPGPRERVKNLRVQLPLGGQFCSRTQVAVGCAGQDGRRTLPPPPPPGKGDSWGRSRLPPGDPRGEGAGGRGRTADTAASAAAAAPGFHWPPCASLTAAAAAAPGPGCGAARGAA